MYITFASREGEEWDSVAGWPPRRPPLLNYSLGNAIIRHKGLSFASALWKLGDINCRGSLPVPRVPAIFHLTCPTSLFLCFSPSLFRFLDLMLFDPRRVAYAAARSNPLRGSSSRNSSSRATWRFYKDTYRSSKLFRALRIPLSCSASVLPFYTKNRPLVSSTRLFSLFLFLSSYFSMQPCRVRVSVLSKSVLACDKYKLEDEARTSRISLEAICIWSAARLLESPET